MASALKKAAKDRVKFCLEMIGLRRRNSYGLRGLDVKAANLINFRRGFFIETGANDGINQSNSYYLERYMGWHGLLIEPIPDLASRCRTNRPKALVEQCALVSSSYPTDTISIQYCNLMSLVQGARRSADEEFAHVKAGTVFLGAGEEPYTVTVPARTLTSVLKKHEITHIDLLSLDVEGYEGDVLRGLDFAQFRPLYILVEANFPDDVEQALGGRYELVATLSHHDRLYRAIGK